MSIRDFSFIALGILLALLFHNIFVGANKNFNKPNVNSPDWIQLNSIIFEGNSVTLDYDIDCSKLRKYNTCGCNE